MIYSASLGAVVRNSLPKKDQSFTTQIDRIVGLLPLDPEVSCMDGVVLGPKDVLGANASKVQTAINNKHKDVCVIFLYTKDQEKNLIKCDFSKMVKRIDAKAVSEVLTEALGEHYIRSGRMEVKSKDFQINGPATKPLEKPVEEVTEAPVETPTEEQEAPKEFVLNAHALDIATGEFTLEQKPDGSIDVHDPEEDDPNNYEDPSGFEEEPEQPVEEEQPTEFVPPAPEMPEEPEPAPAVDTWSCPCGETTNTSKFCKSCGTPRFADQSQTFTATPVEKYTAPTNVVPPAMIESIKNFGDFDLLKKALEKDNVIAQVLAENADYNQIAQMLEVLDANIQTVFLDSTLSAEERYARIKDIGIQRSEFKSRANDIIIKKTMSIFDRTTTIVNEYVDAKVSSMEKALTKITMDKSVIENGGIDIENLINERTKMEFELLELMRNVIDVYKTMDTLTADELSTLDANLPSSNDFVNGVLAPNKKVFTPANTGALASAIMNSLQNQRISMSAMEKRIKAVINVIFKICEQNDAIIQYQANLIKLLKANKVEDVVVIDTMLKGVLRLYIGAEDTGSTATILTTSGLKSRTANTLIVDLSGNGKFEDYGCTVHDWADFVIERPHENLCVVKADGSDPEKVHEIVVELKKFLDYYQFINVKLDYTQVDAISQLCDDAIVAHIISDCRASNVKKLRPAVDAIWTKNIAKKLILVDAPTEDIVSVTKELGCDILTTKVITVPHLTEIKGCAISRKRPHLNDLIAKTFEGAFR